MQSYIYLSWESRTRIKNKNDCDQLSTYIRVANIYQLYILWRCHAACFPSCVWSAGMTTASEKKTATEQEKRVSKDVLHTMDPATDRAEPVQVYTISRLPFEAVYHGRKSMCFSIWTQARDARILYTVTSWTTPIFLGTISCVICTQHGHLCVELVNDQVFVSNT